MTFTSRKTARESLASALTTGMTSAQAVYDYIPNDFATSPVATVSSWSSDPDFGSADFNSIEFIVTFWVLRLNKEADIDYTAEAEDEIDALDQEFKTTLKSWNNGVIARPSETDYAIVNGKQYRTESHFVRIEHYEG